jgi:hypothetical protein
MPNDMPGAARYVRTQTATPTAGVGVYPTWRGSAMEPNIVVDLLPSVSFEASGKGVFDLTTSVQFPRGSRVSGRQGTLDLSIILGSDGTARTVCYLTDNPVEPINVIAVRVDSQNRALLTITRSDTLPVPAGGILDMSGGNATNLETITIGGKVYTFEASLTNVNGHVKVGTTTAESISNLIAAINLGSGKGTAYATATTLHPTVRAEVGPISFSVAVEAKQVGAAGNAITTTETMLNGSWVNGATLVDGSDGNLTVIAEVDPAGPPIRPAVLPGQPARIRLTWDSLNLIAGHIRFATFSYKNEHIANGNWSTDPVTAWVSWQPTHFVLGAGLVDLYGEADFNGTILSAQLSEVVTP